MKTLRRRPLFLLAALLVAAGCGAAPGDGGAAKPAAPAGAGSAKSPAGVEAPSVAVPAVPAGHEPAPAPQPERYQAGLKELDTGVDLSKVETPAAAAPAPGAASSEIVSGLPPEAQGQDPRTDPLASVNRGLEMLGGMTPVEGEEVTHNFGTIRQGESREHVFHFVSNGKQPLIVKAIKPSCGCTKAEIELVTESGEPAPYEKGSEIPIGHKFQLVTEASTDGKGPGAFGAQVSVYSNDPGSPFNVQLRAEIEPVLEIAPDPQIFLGQMTTIESKESTVTVTAKRGERFLLREERAPQATARPVEVKLTPENPDAEGKADKWQVQLVAGPGLEIGMQNIPVQLLSDIVIPNPKYPNADGSPKYFPVMIALQARVIGLVNAEPAFLSFGMVRPGQTMERAVRIECRDDFQLTPQMPVTIQGLYGGDFPYSQYFTTEFVPVEGNEPGKMLDLKLKMTGLPPDLNGSFGGILKVEVGHPSMKELSVRFSGVCRPSLPAATPTGGGGN